MSRLVPRVLAIALAWLLCPLAQADLVTTTPSSTLVAGPVPPSSSPTLPSASFTPAGSVGPANPAGATQNLLGTLVVNTPGAAGTAATTQPYLVTTNDKFELSLWNFVVSIRAQQNNLPLVVANTNLANLGFNLSPNDAAVPLPAAGWLFATGLAGLAGAAWRRRRATAVHTQPA